MAVADFLGTLGAAMGGGFDPRAAMQQKIGQNAPVYQQAQAPQVMPQQAQQRQESPGRKKGVRHFLGVLGDALLTGAGGEPVYGPSVERAEMGEQLAQYLGAASPELAEIFRNNPDAGMALYNAMREDKRFDRTAGQDDRR